MGGVQRTGLPDASSSGRSALGRFDPPPVPASGSPRSVKTGIPRAKVAKQQGPIAHVSA